MNKRMQYYSRLTAPSDKALVRSWAPPVVWGSVGGGSEGQRPGPLPGVRLPAGPAPGGIRGQ